MSSSAESQVATAHPESPTMLSSIPTEILIAIFTRLCDFRSVKSLALTSRVFYHTLLKAESAIVRDVFYNEIEFQSEAVAVVRSFGMTSWDISSVKGALDTYFDEQVNLDDIAWNLSLGMQVHKLHVLVKSFSAEFAASALKKITEASSTPVKENGNSESLAPTQAELRRFERTFWRFELYCNLFRERFQDPQRRIKPLPRIEEDAQQAIFFDRLAPFENEQLGCVHDFLFDQVPSPFDYVAQHDIEWGSEWRTRWVHDYDGSECYNKEALIARGLEKILELRSAVGWGYINELLVPEDPGGHPHSDWNFLFHGLETTDVDSEPELDQLTLDEVKARTTPPKAEESDIGPIKAWKWAYGEFSSNYRFAPKNWWYRQRAYVMWDHRRIVDWGILKLDRSNDIPSKIDFAYEGSREEYEEMWQSQLARDKIYGCGGRGWWEPGDDSWITRRDEEARKEKAREALEWYHR